MERLAVGTIVAGNYAAMARVLCQAMKAQHPTVPICVLLLDGPDNACPEATRIMRLTDVGIPQLDRYLFSRSRLEAASSAKPYLLRHLLDEGFQQVVFLDPDMLPLGPLDALFARAADHAVTLVPHLLTPPVGVNRAQRELLTLLAGVFNGGCIAACDVPAARRALDWWASRVHDYWWSDLGRGLFHDQRWLDLLPAFCADVGVFRDPAYNVAYWNLPERDLTKARLFHFSGFDPARPTIASRFCDSLAIDDLGASAELFRRYATLLESAGWRSTMSAPYAHDSFDNGVPITDEARRLYRELGDEATRFGNPFHTASRDSFFAWLMKRS